MFEELIESSLKKRLAELNLYLDGMLSSCSAEVTKAMVHVLNELSLSRMGIKRVAPEKSSPSVEEAKVQFTMIGSAFPEFDNFKLDQLVKARLFAHVNTSLENIQRARKLLLKASKDMLAGPSTALKPPKLLLESTLLFAEAMAHLSGVEEGSCQGEISAANRLFKQIINQTITSTIQRKQVGGDRFAAIYEQIAFSLIMFQMVSDKQSALFKGMVSQLLPDSFGPTILPKPTEFSTITELADLLTKMARHQFASRGVDKADDTILVGLETQLKALVNRYLQLSLLKPDDSDSNDSDSEGEDDTPPKPTSGDTPADDDPPAAAAGSGTSGEGVSSASPEHEDASEYGSAWQYPYSVDWETPLIASLHDQEVQREKAQAAWRQAEYDQAARQLEVQQVILGYSSEVVRKPKGTPEALEPECDLFSMYTGKPEPEVSPEAAPTPKNLSPTVSASRTIEILLAAACRTPYMMPPMPPEALASSVQRGGSWHPQPAQEEPVDPARIVRPGPQPQRSHSSLPFAQVYVEECSSDSHERPAPAYW